MTKHLEKILSALANDQVPVTNSYMHSVVRQKSPCWSILLLKTTVVMTQFSFHYQHINLRAGAATSIVPS